MSTTFPAFDKLAFQLDIASRALAPSLAEISRMDKLRTELMLPVIRQTALMNDLRETMRPALEAMANSAQISEALRTSMASLRVMEGVQAAMRPGIEEFAKSVNLQQALLPAFAHLGRNDRIFQEISETMRRVAEFGPILGELRIAAEHVEPIDALSSALDPIVTEVSSLGPEVGPMATTETQAQGFIALAVGLLESLASIRGRMDPQTLIIWLMIAQLLVALLQFVECTGGNHTDGGP